MQLHRIQLAHQPHGIASNNYFLQFLQTAKPIFEVAFFGGVKDLMSSCNASIRLQDRTMEQIPKTKNGEYFPCRFF